MSPRSQRLVRLAPVLAVALFTTAATPPTLLKALEAQRALAARAPGDAAMQVDLGNLLLLAGHSVEAEEAYRRALELDPQSVAAHYDLGLLLHQQGRLRQALREYRTVIELDSRHAWAHYQVGTLLEGWRLDGLAVRAYGRAFALDPRLRFADVNPQVIDNRLVTEAMLRGYRDYLPDVTPSMTFEQPRRITALLLQPEEGAPAAAVAETPAPAAVAPRPQVARPPAEQPAEEIVLEPPAGGELSRTIDPSDLRHGSSVGQATPPGAGGGVVRDVDGRGRGGIAPRGPGSRAPGRPGTNPPAQYYPGMPSSGRLNLELYELEPSRPAAVAPAG
jgi:hypothetical protein